MIDRSVVLNEQQVFHSDVVNKAEKLQCKLIRIHKNGGLFVLVFHTYGEGWKSETTSFVINLSHTLTMQHFTHTKTSKKNC